MPKKKNIQIIDSKKSNNSNNSKNSNNSNTNNIKKTICLNMIVKNEAHIITETLTNIYKYIDYWVISDTGSTDGTQDIITNFFKEKGIEGELVNHEWKNFGHNRSLALAAAYNKSDYVFIMDADDLINGELELPKVMDKDAYKFKFGIAFIYYRALILNNRLTWIFKGVLHEYAHCISKENHTSDNINSCYIDSRRLGARNKDSKKYLKDAETLVKSIENNEEPYLNSRYCFYAGQSYRDYNDYENAIKYYKKRISYGGWLEEIYISYMEIGLCQIKLKYSINEISSTFINGFNTIPVRAECLYHLANHYYVKNMIIDAFKIINMALTIKYPEHCILFVNKALHDYAIKVLYFQILLKIDVKNIQITNFSKDKIFQELNKTLKTLLTTDSIPIQIKQFVATLAKLPVNKTNFEDYEFHESLDSNGFDIISFPEKNIHELKEICDKYENAVGFNTYGFIKFNICDQKDMNYIPDKKYNFDGLYVKKSKLNHMMNTKYHENLDFYNKKLIDDIITNISNKQNKKITLTITTCKRLDLFTRTINSFINCCKDILLIDDFICIDDNSSDEDRKQMKSLYPFFTYIFKDETLKSHIHSMNMIIEIVKSEYILHLEDDWLFCQRFDYITKSLEILNQKNIINIDTIPEDQNINDKEIAQVLFNKNYIEIPDDTRHVHGGYLCQTKNNNKYIIHEYYNSYSNKEKFDKITDKYKGHNNIYWPHFSFRPSIFKTEIFKKIGRYNEKTNFFEMEYAKRFVDNNYISCFFNMYPTKHIGKLTFESNNDKPNAYSLNNVNQFNSDYDIIVSPV